MTAARRIASGLEIAISSPYGKNEKCMFCCLYLFVMCYPINFVSIGLSFSITPLLKSFSFKRTGLTFITGYKSNRKQTDCWALTRFNILNLT